MAEAAPERAGGSPLEIITRKVGPLPVWAYAAILVVAYYLYRRHTGGASSTAATSSTGDATANPVPSFDAASGVGGGGIGDTGAPSVVNNYYYGDQNAQQAAGGGTSPGPGVGGATSSGGVVTPAAGGRNGRVDILVPPHLTSGSTSGAHHGEIGVPGGQGSVKVRGGRLTQ